MEVYQMPLCRPCADLLREGGFVVTTVQRGGIVCGCCTQCGRRTLVDLCRVHSRRQKPDLHSLLANITTIERRPRK